MKATDDKNVFQRGKCGIHYVRRRIPRALLGAYPRGQCEIVRSLRTADPRAARSKAILELAAIEAEFRAKRSEIDLSRACEHPVSVRTLTDEQLAGIGTYWFQQVLLGDERRREGGLDDEEFEALGADLQGQRAELARMLAQGRTGPILPALRSFLHLCGIRFNPQPEEAAHAAGTFLRAVVRTLDEQLARHRGDPVESAADGAPGTHPLHIVAPQVSPTATSRSSWSEVLEKWSGFVAGRPKSTVIAYRTAWTALEHFAAKNEVRTPGEVTPLLMTAFVDDMRSSERALAVSTTNGRLSKVKEIYKIACGKHLLAENPATHTLGARQSAAASRRKKRLPFSTADLELIFGSRIFTTQYRSQGQAGEASYWIPILMFYTGARPEEIAGLALSDLRKHPEHGWYLDIVDRPCAEDRHLFDDEPTAGTPKRTGDDDDDEDDDDDIPESHRRTLKTGSSVRRVPVANELIELGLLRYAKWVRSSGSSVFFPTLRKDWHEKLSGAFGKFFGRYLRSLGIDDRRKVLYSLRHNMKDLLESAGMRSKYVKRFLGHASGDGAVTDGYGSDLPLKRMARRFARVRFPEIPALPWQPAEKGRSRKKSKPTQEIPDPVDGGEHQHTFGVVRSRRAHRGAY